MPRKINSTVGQCLCRRRGCDELADIRRQKDHERGALYLVCPVHGVDRAMNAAQQALLDDYIDKHRAESGPDTGPAQAPAQDRPVPAPEGGGKPEGKPAGLAPEPAPDDEGSGFVSKAAKELEDWLND